MSRPRSRIGRAASTTRHTKAGAGNGTRGPLDGRELSMWLGCFHSAIAGSLAAQRRTPNPAYVARWAATLADVALTEITRRTA